LFMELNKNKTTRTKQFTTKQHVCMHKYWHEYPLRTFISEGKSATQFAIT